MASESRLWFVFGQASTSVVRHVESNLRLVEMAGFHSSRERAPGAGVRNSVSLPCPLSERPKTDAAIYTVQKLFGTFLHKKVQEKENRAASRSQRFSVEIDSSLRSEWRGWGAGRVLFRLLRRCAPRNDDAVKQILNCTALLTSSLHDIACKQSLYSNE